MVGFRTTFRRALGPATTTAVLAFLALAVSLFSPAPALAVGETDANAEEKPRVAFVIGNSQYGNINALRNPVNDGKLIAGTLKKLNFTVKEGYDLTLEGTIAMFAENKVLIERAEAVVVYYAGHGFQLGERNYLVPVDATFDDPSKIAEQTVALDNLIERLQDPDRPLFLFLDACRNNPLNGSDGLAQPTVGMNTFIAYATAPGSATKDGSGNNSPYATALARSLEVPGLSILNLDVSVRNETQEQTLGVQNPWSTQTLLTDFFFSERQTLNPNAVLLAANTIMTSGSPEERDAFQVDMDELGLQGAVMRAQQREVSLVKELDLYSAPAPKPAGELATLELSSRDTPRTGAPADASTTAVAAPLATLIFGSRSPEGDAANPGGAPLIDEARLRRQLQTELSRLGCYGMVVDGDWGKGSRAALRRYYEAKRLPVDNLEPTMDALDRTVLDSGRVCRAPVAVQKAKERRKDTPVASREDRGARTGPANNKRNVRPEKRIGKPTQQTYRRAPARGQTVQAKKERQQQRREIRNDLGIGVGMGL